jgi:hypothetical protein
VNPDPWVLPAERLGAAADLDATWMPRGQYVVDDEGGAAGSPDVAELLGGSEVVSADLDYAGSRIEVPVDRRDVRRAVGADGGESA